MFHCSKTIMKEEEGRNVIIHPGQRDENNYVIPLGSIKQCLQNLLLKTL